MKQYFRTLLTTSRSISILYFALLACLAASCDDDDSPESLPVDIISDLDELTFDRYHPKDSVMISMEDTTVRWTLESSNSSLILSATEGTGDIIVHISVDFAGFTLGVHEEAITLMIDDDTYELPVTITSHNITGVWEGTYSWKCSEALIGAMPIRYEIQDHLSEDSLYGSFTGKVVMNGGESTFRFGYIEYSPAGHPEDKIYVKFDFAGAPTYFANNDFSGYIDLNTVTMEGFAINGDSPAYEGATGCSADEGKAGTVVAHLKDGEVPDINKFEVSKRHLEVDRFNSEATFEISSTSGEVLSWEIESSNPYLIFQSSGMGDTTVTVGFDRSMFPLGIHNEELIVRAGDEELNISIAITSHNISGIWEGTYAWECTEELTGSMPIRYEIVDNLSEDPNYGSFEGKVVMNGGEIDLRFGYMEYDTLSHPQGKIFVKLEFFEVPDHFVNNTFEGYIDIASKTMEGVTLNGDTPAHEATNGCSADEGFAGTVSAELID